MLFCADVTMLLLSVRIEELPEFELGCAPEITLRRESPHWKQSTHNSAEQEGEGEREGAHELSRGDFPFED